MPSIYIVKDSNTVYFVSPGATQYAANTYNDVFNAALGGEKPAEITKIDDIGRYSVDSLDCIETILDLERDTENDVIKVKVGDKFEITYYKEFIYKHIPSIDVYMLTIGRIDIKNGEYTAPWVGHIDTTKNSVYAQPFITFDLDITIPKIYMNDKMLHVIFVNGDGYSKWWARCDKIARYMNCGYAAYEYLTPEIPRKIYFDIDNYNEDEVTALNTFEQMMKDLKTFLGISSDIKYTVTVNRRSIHGGNSYHIITNLVSPSYKQLRFLTRNFMCAIFEDGVWVNKDDNNSAIRYVDDSWFPKKNTSFPVSETNMKRNGTYSFIDPYVSNAHQLFRLPYSYNAMKRLIADEAKYKKYIEEDEYDFKDSFDHSWAAHLSWRNTNMNSRYDDFHVILRNETSPFIQDTNECIFISKCYSGQIHHIDDILDQKNIRDHIECIDKKNIKDQIE